MAPVAHALEAGDAVAPADPLTVTSKPWLREATSSAYQKTHHRSNSISTPNVWQVSAVPSSTEYFDESLRQHMLRMYNYMAAVGS